MEYFFSKCLSEIFPRKIKINLWGRFMVRLGGLWFWGIWPQDFLEVRGEAHQYLAFKEKYKPGIRVMLFTLPLVVSWELGSRSSDGLF